MYIMFFSHRPSIMKFIGNVSEILRIPAKRSGSLFRRQISSGFSQNLHSNLFPFPKIFTDTDQRSSFCDAPFRAASSTPNPDDRITREAELICKLVSENGNPRNLVSSLSAANCCDASPGLVLQVLNKLSNAGTKGLLFFRWAEKQGNFRHTSECYHELIESMGKIKQFKMVWSLVDEMKNHGLLSKDTFAFVSRRLVRAKKVRDAMDLLEQMEEKYGFKPGVQDFNRLLDSLCKSRQVELAQEVFDKWKKRRFAPDKKSYTILLEGWSQKCNFLRLNEVHHEMEGDGFEHDVVSYGILINAYCKSKNFNEAIRLFRTMNRKGVRATPHIYCILIYSLGAEKRLDEAVDFFMEYRSGNFVKDVPTYNAMVGAYCSSGRIHDAHRLVDEMRRCGIGPNARTYDIILHHLVKDEKFEEAYCLFKKMRDEYGVEPAVKTYEIMVRMFCREERMDLGLKIWGLMRCAGVVPGVTMFHALISGLCKDYKLDEACEYFQEMVDMGIRPPKHLFHILKRALLHEGKEDMVILLDHKLEKLRHSPLSG